MISRHFYREFKKILRNFQFIFRRFAKKSETGTKLGFSYNKNVYRMSCAVKYRIPTKLNNECREENLTEYRYPRRSSVPNTYAKNGK